jgi:hypothetical protein
MRRFLSALVLVGLISPASALGAMSRADLQAAYQSALKQAITLLMQEVSELEAQLAAIQGTQSMPSVVSAPMIAVPSSSAATSTSSSTYSISSSVAATSSASSSTVTAITTESSTGSGTGFGISANSISQNGKMPLEKIGTITIGAGNSGPIELASLKLTFSGNGYAAGSSTFLNTVSLRDPNAVDVTASFSATETKDANAGTIAWTFPASAGNLPVISPGMQLTLQLWAETDIIPGMSGTAESLSATVQNPNDLTFYDGSDPAAIAIGPIPLSITEAPFTVTSLSWGVGM